MRQVSFRSIIALSLLLAACGNDGSTAEAVPAAPTNVLATPGPGYVTVTWQDNSDDETGFVVYRESATGTAVSVQALEPVGEVPIDVESFVDGSVEPGVEYAYAVAAVGAQANSASVGAAASATVAPGIDLAVGTYNVAPVLAEVQTAFAFYVFLPPEDLPTQPVDVSIVGPAGWNGDTPYEFVASAARFASGWSWAAAFTPVVAGAYTATVMVDGTEYAATASTDASGVLGVAQNPSVTGHGSESVSLAWDGPAGAMSYGATIYDAPLRLGANAFGRAITTDTALTVDGLALPEGEYYATVFAFPIDRTVARPLKPAEFDVSAAVTPVFAVGAAGCVDPDPISDPNLAAAIRDDLGLSGPPSCADLLDLAYFTAADRGITDLTGLEYAQNTFDAALNGNDIANLTPLAPLVKMVKLYLDQNRVADLSPLMDMVLLDTLVLRSNDIVDISMLLGNEGLDVGDVLDLRDNPLDLSEGSSVLVDIAALEARGVNVLHDGLVVIDGVWSTSLTAIESSCVEVPVGTVVAGDVTFQTYLNEVTATSDSGAISTGTRFQDTVTLTRSDTAPGGETYEVVSVSEWQADQFAGESVYTFEGGCVVTWEFSGSRIID